MLLQGVLFVLCQALVTPPVFQVVFRYISTTLGGQSVTMTLAILRQELLVVSWVTLITLRTGQQVDRLSKKIFCNKNDISPKCTVMGDNISFLCNIALLYLDLFG